MASPRLGAPKASGCTERSRPSCVKYLEARRGGSSCTISLEPERCDEAVYGFCAL